MASRAGRPCTIDADGDDGPGPMLALLLAAAGCSGADVVSILEKMQVKLRKFTTEVDRGPGARASQTVPSIALPDHPGR